MADKTIDELSDGVTAQTTDEIPVWRAGSTLKITVDYIKTLFNSAYSALTHTHSESDVVNLTTDLALKEDIANKNATNGYAGLTASKLNGAQQTYGSTVNTACQGNDSRLSDSRTPTAHSHTESDVTNLTTDLAAKEAIANKNATNGYAGLTSGKLDGTQQVYGSAVNTACQGNDSRLTDNRTPTAHHLTHETGGTDFVTIKDSDLSLSDITTNNVSITKHGFVPKAPNDVTQFLNGVGAYSVPPGTGGGGAPTTSSYLTLGTDATLTNERVLTAGTNISFTDNGAGSTLVVNSTAPTGDFSSNTSTSVDGEVVLFSGTTGKLGKRSTGTGVTRISSGVQSASELSGDVVTSGSNVATIANNAVTYAKQQDVSAASRLLGRGSAAGAGDCEEITLGGGLTMTGTVLDAPGGGGGAPTSSQYLTLATDATLTNERVLTPGSGLTGTDGGAGSTYTLGISQAVVTGDVTHAQSSIVLTNITGLAFNIGASATEVWYFEIVMIFNSPATADIKFGFTVPTGATMVWGSHNAGPTQDFFNSPIGAGPTTPLTEATGQQCEGRTGDALAFWRGWVFGGGTSGAVQMQFAQVTAGAVNTIVRKGTFVQFRRLAT